MEIDERRLSSPLLRLDASTWSYLLDFLDTRSALRLASSGSLPIVERVKQNARVLRLTWSSSRFMDFDEVFAVVNRFPRLVDLDFSPQMPYHLHWTPINWPSLSPALTSLSLHFHASIQALLSPHSVLSTLASLEKLILAEPLNEHPRLPHNCLIDFRGLPPRLTKLSLSTENTYHYAFAHFESLPSTLTSLKLKLTMKRLPEDGFAQSISVSPFTPASLGEVTLPRLPPGLTSLYLHHDPDIQVDFAKLPKSLRRLEHPQLAYTFDKIPGAPFFNITPTSMAHLSKLEVLLLPETLIYVQNAVLAIPRSVTKLALFLTWQSVEELTDPVLLDLLGKYDRYKSTGGIALDDIVIKNLWRLPNIKEIELDDYEGNEPIDIPSTVSCFYGLKDEGAKLPDGLKYLAFAQSATSFHILPIALKQLHVCDGLLVWDLAALPSTLEKLSGSFPPNAWMELLNVLKDPTRLPKLAYLHNYEQLRSLDYLPPQLRQLNFDLTSDSNYRPPFDLNMLPVLKNSSLIEINMHANELRTAEDLALLLNHLPVGLTTLRLWTLDVLSREHPVVFPPNLTDFMYFPRQVFQPSSITPQGDHFLPQLPSLLHRLEIFSSKTKVDVKELPSALSLFRGDQRAEWEADLASRKPPQGNRDRTLVTPP